MVAVAGTTAGSISLVAHLTRAGMDHLSADEQFTEVLRRTATALGGLAAHPDQQSPPAAS